MSNAGFTPTPERVLKLWKRGRDYNDSVNLAGTVGTNESFFIGRQWEGVKANGLPTPVFNILKRDVLFVVSSITSDALGVMASPVSGSAENEETRLEAKVLNGELNALAEVNELPTIARAIARDAAVRGDGCLYSWWDPAISLGDGRMGAVRTELIENTRVYFGNPNDGEVESQPYIIIESRESPEKVRERAALYGIERAEDIAPERNDDKCTVLLTLWRADDGGIHGFESCGEQTVRPEFDLGIRRYPITWLQWDKITDSYHGEAMISGLIPNQIFINKAWAMSALSLMTTAYPKVIYDKTRIQKWDNRVGAAIGVQGGDMNSVARIMDPAQVSPQIAQFLEMAIEQTNRSLGASSAALGDVKPENTSAIIALQRAAATPNEITKQNLRRALESLIRVYLEFIVSCYGVRKVWDGEEERLFDFGALRERPWSVKIEVGASTYFSEIAGIQTLDKLLADGHITLAQYLRRIPEGYIPDKRGLMNEIRGGDEHGGN